MRPLRRVSLHACARRRAIPACGRRDRARYGDRRPLRPAQAALCRLCRLRPGRRAGRALHHRGRAALLQQQPYRGVVLRQPHEHAEKGRPQGRRRSLRRRRAARGPVHRRRRDGRHQQARRPAGRLGRGSGGRSSAGHPRPLRTSFQHPALAGKRCRNRRDRRGRAWRAASRRTRRGAARVDGAAAHLRVQRGVQRHRDSHQRRGRDPAGEGGRRADDLGLCGRRPLPADLHVAGAGCGDRRDRAVAAQIRRRAGSIRRDDPAARCRVG